MSEWWTYRPADFLMFAPDIYWRLFEDLNRACWPLQPLAVIAGMTWLLSCLRNAGQQTDRSMRLAFFVVGAAWAWAGWAFLWQRFAPINWIAGSAAALFVLQALLLAANAAWASRPRVASGPRLWIGLGLGFWALLGHPLLGLVAGRPLWQAEVFGFAPDPTAIGTIALLLLANPEQRLQRVLAWLAWPIPLAWCLASAAMFWAMGSAQGWLMLAAAGLPLAAAASASYNSRPATAQPLRRR
ncbi:DUF6064 family protein [Piscinibacter sakaiensis]|uniref:DUF6064 family protein n=1 Tax=Piscinibacter sakaiensis TaxID=1547922 RepID=UPI003AAA58FE